MQFSRWKNIIVVLIMVAVLSFCAPLIFQEKIETIFQVSTDSDKQINSVVTNEIDLPQLPLLPAQKLSNPPEIIKAVYVTGYSASQKNYLKYLSSLFQTTEVNAVVIDVKGSDGVVTYPELIPDIDALIRFFHDQNIYVIGRIAVFEDPKFSKTRPDLAIYNKAKTTDIAKPVLWLDNNGLSWLDPSSKDVWDYNISLAKDAFYHGFDEVNFDYIRFATDGNMENMGFPIYDGKKQRSKVIKEFFQYLRVQLVGEKISADLFGQVTTDNGDMGIGQLLENAFENFDYICPMVYPSHYISGFNGFENPAEHPYEIIKYSMDKAALRKIVYSKAQQNYFLQISEATGTPAYMSQTKELPEKNNLAKFRPWLQDFDMGANYTADMVKKEIQATQDSLQDDYSGFMLWNPSNIYTSGALLK
jgi:hypothetical protein